MIERPSVRKTKRLDYTALDAGGKLPPQAPEFEEAILGAIMLEKEALKDAMETLQAKHFYVDAHQYVFECMIDIYNDNHPVDILTVTEKLKTKGYLEIVGGPYFIAKLTSRVSSAANLQYHAHIVIQKFIQRELIRISGQTLTDAFDDTADAFKLLDATEKDLYEVKNDGMKRSYQEISDVMEIAIKQIEANVEKKDGLTGVPSGLKTLDHITAGWQKSDLIILAARPGMGKTALALSMLRNAAVDFHKAVAIFSLEMSAPQLVTRLIASESGLSSEKLKKGQLEDHEWAQLHSKIQRLSKAKIFIDDTPSLPVFELKAKCRRLHSKHNIELVVIDYLQLMRGEDSGNKNGNREQEISYISRSLKALAKELNIPIIALAQLSRDVEKRGGDKKPQLSDLRESGSIEQDADMVGFIWRPDYYKFSDSGYETDPYMAEIIIAKHRNGPTDTAKVKYINTLARFDNYDENEAYNNIDEDGPKTVTFSSKVNTDGDDSISKTDMYAFGKSKLNESTDASAPPMPPDEDWNIDTGANITDDNPWE
jgi:replicative DNA helicase